MSEPAHPLPRFLCYLGAKATGTFSHIGTMWFLLTNAGMWIVRAVYEPRVRFGRTAIVSQMVRVGVNSVFIVSLVPNIIAVAVLRELGPLVAAIVMVGFAGAAIAAEIGTMVVGEEIEALEAHALNPVRFLVVPRVIATVASMVCLAVISDFVAVFSAAFMSKTVLDISWVTYFANTDAQVGPLAFLTGVVKAGIFGLLIGLIACGNGLKVTGGAAGVGNATTNTVVQSVVAVIVADLIFTIVFYALGLFD